MLAEYNNKSKRRFEADGVFAEKPTRGGRREDYKEVA